MLAAENWCVKVEEKVYGPYSSEQMRKYAHEGRLAAWSLIAPAGSRAWREARREATFANFFGADNVAASANERAFGKRGAPEAQKGFGSAKLQAPALSNFLVIFDTMDNAANRMESAVVSLGNAFKVADNVWSVSSDLTAVGVRNAIAPYLTPRETIFVVDASRGRTSWQNYSPEAHAKISAAYTANLVKARAS